MIMTFHGRAIHESVATSAGVGVMVSIPGALGWVCRRSPQDSSRLRRCWL
jgi:hypothetical protein